MLDLAALRPIGALFQQVPEEMGQEASGPRRPPTLDETLQWAKTGPSTKSDSAWRTFGVTVIVIVAIWVMFVLSRPQRAKSVRRHKQAYLEEESAA